MLTNIPTPVSPSGPVTRHAFTLFLCVLWNDVMVTFAVLLSRVEVVTSRVPDNEADLEKTDVWRWRNSKSTVSGLSGMSNEPPLAWRNAPPSGPASDIRASDTAQALPLTQRSSTTSEGISQCPQYR